MDTNIRFKFGLQKPLGERSLRESYSMTLFSSKILEPALGFSFFLWTQTLVFILLSLGYFTQVKRKGKLD